MTACSGEVFVDHHQEILVLGTHLLYVKLGDFIFPLKPCFELSFRPNSGLKSN